MALLSKLFTKYLCAIYIWGPYYEKYFTDKNIFLTSVAETVEEPLCPEHGSAGEGGLHGGDVLGGDLLPPGDGLLGPHLQHLVRVLERLGVGAARVVHVGVRGVVAATCI